MLLCQLQAKAMGVANLFEHGLFFAIGIPCASWGVDIVVRFLFCGFGFESTAVLICDKDIDWRINWFAGNFFPNDRTQYG